MPIVLQNGDVLEPIILHDNDFKSPFMTTDGFIEDLKSVPPAPRIVVDDSFVWVQEATCSADGIEFIDEDHIQVLVNGSKIEDSGTEKEGLDDSSTEASEIIKCLPNPSKEVVKPAYVQNDETTVLNNHSAKRYNTRSHMKRNYECCSNNNWLKCIQSKKPKSILNESSLNKKKYISHVPNKDCSSPELYTDLDHCKEELEAIRYLSDSDVQTIDQKSKPLLPKDHALPLEQVVGPESINDHDKTTTFHNLSAKRYNTRTRMKKSSKCSLNCLECNAISLLHIKKPKYRSRQFDKESQTTKRITYRSCDSISVAALRTKRKIEEQIRRDELMAAFKGMQDTLMDVSLLEYPSKQSLLDGAINTIKDLHIESKKLQEEEAIAITFQKKLLHIIKTKTS